MNENKSIKNFFTTISKNKLIKIIIVILLSLLVAVIAFSGLFNINQNKSNTDIDVYVDNLEEKLTKMLSNIDGAGKVSVAISVDGGWETVLAMKTTVKENNGVVEREETPILVNGKTVILKEIYPRAEGVLIIAEGADNIMVYRKIQQATLSLVDVELNKIEIIKMK